MKKIEAYIRPFKLEELKKELLALGVSELRFFPVQEWSEVHVQEFYRGTVFEVDFVTRTVLMLLVEDEAVERVIRVIQNLCSTGSRQESGEGDGRVLVIPVEREVRL
ncbi:P-II family nitrogen regulator [Leptonema illini]|uniref:Nitrogen regulatory protein P-II n=1 Tax=Leptonema illini DSM 21528 TaxID=929563 RepID=H2CKA0_9LEPT|nr:P-II family nitrogen regulator [Leptonema illini]EHQ07203.1 nitrogen regulatory protein P-II [Leptonema illini DSM 21528]